MKYFTSQKTLQIRFYYVLQSFLTIILTTNTRSVSAVVFFVPMKDVHKLKV